jgi:hypothetical protein
MGRLGSGILGSKTAQFGLLELAGIFQPEGVESASLEAHGYLRARGRIYGDDVGFPLISPRGHTFLFRRFKGTTIISTVERVIPHPYAKS